VRGFGMGPECTMLDLAAGTAKSTGGLLPLVG
jgi:hypothetical protein